MIRRNKRIEGQITRYKTRRGKRLTRIGVWNVRAISGKEDELVEEIKKSRVDFLGVTETKKKGKGSVWLRDDYMFIYSGVSTSERARGGVGCIFHKDIVSSIKDWKLVDERIMTVDWEEVGKPYTLIVVYAPTDTSPLDEKERFYQNLQREVDESKGFPIIMGDLNGRIGNNPNDWEDVMGIHGEACFNENGERILQFCTTNEMIAGNSRFPHKDIHKYTREERSRGEKSVIDYFLVSKGIWKEIIDIRVKRGFEIGSDHYLLIMEKWCNEDYKRGSRNRKNCNETIKAYKLKNGNVAKDYQEKIEEKAIQLSAEWNNLDLERSWGTFKEILLNSAEESCGRNKVGQKKKRTAWWNDEIREEVKKKKQAWKDYLRTGALAEYNLYKEHRTRVKNLVSTAKRKTWEEFGESMEKNYKGNKKLFYKVIKNMKREKEPALKFIKDKRGNILRKELEIMNRWEDYFKELLQDENGVEEISREVGRGSHESGAQFEEDDYIDEFELAMALDNLKLGKAAGHDNITPEMIKYMGNKGEQILLHVFNLAWKQKTIPTDWEVSVIVPIFKKGDNRECGNHRGISLLSIPGKLYAKILEKRLRRIIDSQMHEAQCGFRNFRSTQDLIFALRQISEKVIGKNKKVCACFVDLEKAFDRVRRKDIIESLTRKGADLGLRRAVESLYVKTRSYVRTANANSRQFETSGGIRQGCSLSPLLFVTALDDALQKSHERMRKFEVGFNRMSRVSLSLLAFADDIVVLANNAENLQHNLIILQEELAKINMKISGEKTKTMEISKIKGSPLNVSLNQDALEQVVNFKYLGVNINEEGRIDKEINDRIASAGRLFNALKRGFINKKEVSKGTKVAVFKSTYLPVLTYGSESWTLTSKHRSRIQAAEMRFLRRIAGKTRRDRIRNVHIRSNLEVTPIEGVLRENRLRWYGHVMRMGSERIARSCFEARMQGHRGRGRPRITWEDVIKEDFRAKSLDWSKRGKLTEDRDSWRTLWKDTSTPQGRRGLD